MDFLVNEQHVSSTKDPTLWRTYRLFVYERTNGRRTLVTRHLNSLSNTLSSDIGRLSVHGTSYCN